MRSYEHTLTIDASPLVVWALTADVERWPSMFPTVTSAERLDDGPLRVGSKARLKQPGQPHRVWTVTEFVPDRRFVWTTGAKGFTMVATHTLTRHARTETDLEGTVNTLRIEVHGPLAIAIAALAGRRIRRLLTIENQGLRDAAMANNRR